MSLRKRGASRWGRRSETKRKPLFTRESYAVEAKILETASALMDGRDMNAKRYRKLAAMLVFADIHMPKGLPNDKK